MGADINIPMSDLERLNTTLGNVITDFEKARSRGDALEAAVGSPHGEGALRSEIDRFESDWDDKRETLRQKLEDAKQRLVDFVTAWSDFDLDAAKSMDTTENRPQVEDPRKQSGTR